MSKNTPELTRKEMKAPDAFQTAAARAATWISGKQRHIVAGVLGALAAVAVVLAILAWMDARRETAGTKLYAVLEDADGQVSSVPLPGVTVPIFPTAEAQYRSVLGKADDLRKGYPSTSAARTAALAAAAAHLRLAAWDAAIAEYAAYLADAGTPDSLVFVAIEGQARAREAKGDLAGALSGFEQLQAKAPARADRATIERARLLARTGKADEARKLLQGFPGEFKESTLRPDAERLLASLGGPR